MDNKCLKCAFNINYIDGTFCKIYSIYNKDSAECEDFASVIRDIILCEDCTKYNKELKICNWLQRKMEYCSSATIKNEGECLE